MDLKPRNTHCEGFTLIELMIVIAIISILAAIAIPNFIAYRDKAYCSSAEADANQIEAFIADYYAIPEHVALVEAANSTNYYGYELNAKGNQNTATVTFSNSDTNSTITIVVTEANSRCPENYMLASEKNKTEGLTGGWDSATWTYTKYMNPAQLE